MDAETVIKVTEFLNTPSGQWAIRVGGVFLLSHYLLGGLVYDILDNYMDTKKAERKFKVKKYSAYIANILCGLFVAWLYQEYSNVREFFQSSFKYIIVSLAVHIYMEYRKEKERIKRIDK